MECFGETFTTLENCKNSAEINRTAENHIEMKLFWKLSQLCAPTICKGNCFIFTKPEKEFLWFGFSSNGTFLDELRILSVFGFRIYFVQT